MKSTLIADIPSARAENKYVKCMPAPAARGKNSHFNLVQKTERALVVCSLYSGFVGASALSAGLHELFDGGLSRWALGLAFFGGMLAVASWRCARSVAMPSGFPKGQAQFAQALWRRVVASYPNDPRNEVAPFASGIE